jgi:hypothetical protein
MVEQNKLTTDVTPDNWQEVLSQLQERPGFNNFVWPVERGEKPVLMDNTAQNSAINEIVDLAKVTLVAGDVLRPLSIVDVLRSHNISKIVHTAANPMLTVGVQKEPYSAINLNIMGTVNVLEAARVTDIKRVVVSSSSVLNYYLEGGEDGGDFGKEEAFPRRRSRSRISSAPNRVSRSMKRVVGMIDGDEYDALTRIGRAVHTLKTGKHARITDPADCGLGYSVTIPLATELYLTQAVGSRVPACDGAKLTLLQLPSITSAAP